LDLLRFQGAKVKAQVCRLESGKSITLASMMRAFRALGVQVALEMKGIGKVAL
jgi:hypothetical protein